MAEDEVKQAIDEVQAAASALASEPITAQPVEFSSFEGEEKGTPAAAAASPDTSLNLKLLMDVPVPISVEVGRAQMRLEEIVQLGPGSIVPLDKRAEEAVELRVNGKLVARGEVVLVDDCYGLRITQIVDTAGRIESLKAGGGAGPTGS
jgi:flagellar motor switch protein FliN/FliY